MVSGCEDGKVIEFFSSLLVFWLFRTENISIIFSRAESISHSFAALTRERYFLHSKIKFRIPKRPCNILYLEISSDSDRRRLCLRRLAVFGSLDRVLNLQVQTTSHMLLFYHFWNNPNSLLTITLGIGILQTSSNVLLCSLRTIPGHPIITYICKQMWISKQIARTEKV